MTLDQFKQALINMGYKEPEYSDTEHMRYKKRNKEVCVQDLGYLPRNINIYFTINRKNYDVEHHQHGVKDFTKALKNIEKFERKIGR